jgi:histidine triad (HIT) family protein
MDLERTVFHAPPDYVCPFCLIVAGVESEHVWTEQQDVVYRDTHVNAFVAAAWWPNNPGHVIIVPNEHFENIFDLPLVYATALHAAAQKIAVAFKHTYRCDGVSTRQHNEPAGNQDVWHYHLHVFPRYHNDRLYELIRQRRRTTPEERIAYAVRLRQALRHSC